MIAHRAHRSISLVLVLACFVPFASGQAPELLRFEYSAPAMGSRIDFIVYSDRESKAKFAIESGMAEVERLTLLLSNYDSTSEISRVCEAPVGQWTAMSHDLATVLTQSRRWHILSDGSFDVTVGPLTSLWRASRKTKKLPGLSEIENAKQRCGWTSVVWDSDSNVSLLKAQMQLDLSGIAVGYIVDMAFEKMVASGTPIVLINAGGDIRVGAAPPGSEGWRVTVAGLGKTSPPLAMLRLRNCAITTSGDLNQFVEIDGHRYSHFIDPHSGNPIERRQSVTALAKTTLDADAGATALAVLGMHRASELFGQLPLIEAILVESSPNEIDAIKLRRLSKE
jgi:FAD:protein FMN transferase